MEQVYHDVGLSMTFLKIAGLLLLLFAAAFILMVSPHSLPKWKNILRLGFLIGLLNAGLVIFMGKIAFPLTPAILLLLSVLYYFNKFPLYKIQHFLGLLVFFIFSSVTFFLGIAGIFFHLAVEGKL